MDTQQSLIPWDEPGWLEEITAWVGARLAERGLVSSGQLEIIHKRTWSAFAKIPTGGGIVYFKAAAPALKHEIGLTSLLAGWRSDCITPVLAADPGKGWMLSLDCGVTLRALDRTTAQLAYWDQLLPLYAGLQQEVAPNIDAMLAVGVPDHRLAILPELFKNLLSDTSALRVGLEGGLTRDEHTRLLGLVPRVADLCAELAGFGIPETIMHEEIHENNVLLSGDTFIFTDWSDCSISHPFLSLLVTLRATAHWLKLEESAPQITHLRDIYLDAWGQYGPRDHLRRASGLAYVLGMLSRSLSYYLSLGPLPEQYRIENDSISGWLQDFLVGLAALDG